MWFHYKDKKPYLVGLRSWLQMLSSREAAMATVTAKMVVEMPIPRFNQPEMENIVYQPPPTTPVTVLHVRLTDPQEGEIEADVEVPVSQGNAFHVNDQIPVEYQISRQFGNINAHFKG